MIEKIGPTVYKGEIIYNQSRLYKTSSVYKDIKEGYNIPYFSDFTNFNTIDLYDVPIIGRKEYVKNHQNLIYSKSTLVYGGDTFNAIKVTQPGGNIAATDEMFNFGGRNYEIEFIQFIDKLSTYNNFSIWLKLGYKWFGFGIYHSRTNLMILSQSNDYRLYNGASYFTASGGYDWVDTGITGATPSKTKIKTNGNEVSFFVEGHLKLSIELEDVFMNCFNFSPRYSKSFYMTELKINWV
jgi:hypothetical protein